MTDPAPSVQNRHPEGFIVLDSEWRYTFVSPQASRIIGKRADELVGRRIWSVYPGPEVQPFRAACEQALHELEPVVVESVCAETGRLHESRIFPSPFGLTVVFGDVTESRGADAQLAGVDDPFRQLTDSIREILWLISVPDSEIIYISPNFASVWGEDAPEVIRNPLTFLRAVHPSDHNALAGGFQRAQRGQEAVAEYRIMRKGSDDRWMRTRFFPIRDENGIVHRMAGATEDISDRKALEAQLVQAQKMEAIGRLAGGIAHDFNNHLTAIIGFSKLLENELAPETELTEYLAEILKAAERSATLTNKLLAFSRRQILQPQFLDAREVVEGVDLILRRTIGTNIELVTVPGSAPAMVKADPTQLEQALVNLVLNARDAMPAGGRIIVQVLKRRFEVPTLRSHGMIPPGDWVVLAVSDEGCGMDDATLARIFDPFFTTKGPDQGTGLGLPMVLGIVQQSGGHVAVFSRPGGGTTVKVYLPSIVDRAQSVAVPKAEVAGGERGTVLVVDDERAVRALSGTMLRRAGYYVLEAENGVEGLRVWSEHKDRIDLVVTDLTMPQMGGRELGRRIGADTDPVPVIYMSGYSHELQDGSDMVLPTRFLEKPFAPEQLVRIVDVTISTGKIKEPRASH